MAASRMTDQMGVRYAGASAVLVALTGLVAGCGVHGVAAVILYLGVALACAPWLPGLSALALGLTAWAYCTGFGVHQDGTLTLAGDDQLRLLLFSLGTMADSVISGWLVHRARHCSMAAQ